MTDITRMLNTTQAYGEAVASLIASIPIANDTWGTLFSPYHRYYKYGKNGVITHSFMQNYRFVFVTYCKGNCYVHYDTVGRVSATK